KPSKLPLILISLKEHRSEFKKISNNPYLLDAGISKSIESLGLEEIQRNARMIIEAIHSEKMEKMAASYAKAEADSLGSSNVAQVAKAAYESRIETMLIEEDQMIPGKIDTGTGEIERGDLEHPEHDDILDDLAESVLSSGGNVYVLPKDRMPGNTGIAAIFRYV
ncbi:MAG: hypothetical protein QM215_05280, partial [Bacillota bacterium]|nr:hypothetical protein [Bacillota bacterium]